MASARSARAIVVNRNQLEDVMATWQIALYVAGAVMMLAYFKRRADRLNTGE
jgi:hypothetical protein